MSLPIERAAEIQAEVSGQPAVIPPTKRSPWEFQASTPDGEEV